MKKLTIIAALCIISLASAHNVANAQDKPFSISFGGGGGSVPLNDVIKFTEIVHTFIQDGGRGYDFFDKEDVGKIAFFNIAYNITDAWGASLLFETINISAKGKSTFGGLAGSMGTAIEEWEFTSFPISVVYEFFIRGRHNRFSPVLGFGPSLYINKMIKKDVFTSSFTGAKSNTEFKENQIVYGFLLFLELQSSINNKFFINSRFQARFAEGMKIQDKQTLHNYDVDFTGVNFTLGFGWRF